ncbi:hypothetical protein VP01_802g4 [Puccinia sorghi]|uniref:Cyclin C-terminal domain-containing protein n=1 Tax=Puccinia sorghi TaxID=27349 RepID=A0A0L6UAD7_9BASI|nr:hypothetical protein VP01_802g4 [Puccinia sorghi]
MNTRNRSIGSRAGQKGTERGRRGEGQVQAGRREGKVRQLISCSGVIQRGRSSPYALPQNVELPSAGDGPTEPSQIEYLTVQDELELVTFYLSKISQLCRASIFNFPETVEATAMSYLKRFYLRNTCMDYHPKNIIFASRIPKTTNEDVLALEFLVAQSLKFQFKVHHAHLAARGIYLDLQHCPQAGSVGTDRLGQVWPEVCALLRAARLTDLEFLWTPSQIACAAWWTADREVTEVWLKSKANRVASTSSSSDASTANQDLLPTTLGLDPLLRHLQDLSQILIHAQHKPIDKDRVTAVDRRLRFCRNPEKDPNSALFKIKQAQLDTANLAKHHQKFPAGSNQDPFS